jgi:hypothetical protein
MLRRSGLLSQNRTLLLLNESLILLQQGRVLLLLLHIRLLLEIGLEQVPERRKINIC